MAAKTRKSRFDTVRELDEQIQCFELRKTGISIEEIAKELALDVETVKKRIMDVVNDKKLILPEYAQQQRELIMARVDSLVDAIWDDARDGNLYAIDRLIRLNDQAISLSGAKLDKLDITSNGKPLESVTGETIKNAMVEAARQIEEYKKEKEEKRA